MSSNAARAPKTETHWRITYEIAGRTFTTARFDDEQIVRARALNTIDDRAENVRIVVETSVTTYREVPVAEFTGAQLPAKDDEERRDAAATTTRSYAQTVTVLARQYHELAVDGEIPPNEWVRIKSELHAAADGAGVSSAVADEDFAEELQTAFVDRYAD